MLRASVHLTKGAQSCVCVSINEESLFSQLFIPYGTQLNVTLTETWTQSTPSSSFFNKCVSDNNTPTLQ